jgi:serine/threonine protein kinase
MSSDLVEKFLAVFDDSQYPPDFLQRYELMECLAHNSQGETLLVRDQRTDKMYVAKCYTDLSLLPRTSESSLLRNFHHDGLPAFVGEYRNESMLCVVRDYVEGTPLDRLACRSALNQPKSAYHPPRYQTAEYHRGRERPNHPDRFRHLTHL